MGKDVMAICGFAITTVSTFCTILAFSTPHWLESYDNAKSQFDRLGLWEACFNRYIYEKDGRDKPYDGCWWIFSYEYKPILDWLIPGWFLAVQVMMTLTMIISFVVTLLCLLGLLGFCPPKRAAIAALINSILMFLCSVLLTVSIILFGVKSDTDRQWMPEPDRNRLGWSFIVAVIAGFLAIFAGMCLTVQFLRLQFQARKHRPTLQFRGYEMNRAPSDY